MALSLINNHGQNCDAISYGPLDVPEPAVATVLRADSEKAEDLDLDESNVIEVF